MTASIPTTNRAGRGLSPIIGDGLFVLSLALIVVGDVVAFNQLATQSPTDAIVPILVFVIGAAGLVEALRRAFFAGSGRVRPSAVIPALASLAAFVMWRRATPVGWSVILTLAATVFFGSLAIRDLRRSRSTDGANEDSAQIRGLLCLAQTLVLAYVALLAAADAGPTVFG